MAGIRWTEQEIQFVKDNIRLLSSAEIAKHLGRTIKSLQHLYQKLNISTKGKHLVGDRFGKLIILEEPYFIDKYGQNISYAKFKCDCGNEKVFKVAYVVCADEKYIVSCGCEHKKNKIAKIISRTKYIDKGKYHDILYRVYHGMKNRCLNEKMISYHRYGGRGITICQEWLDDFINFYNWSMAHGYKPSLTLDRINNNGNYEPSNCRWTTYLENGRNKENNVADTLSITAFGETKPARAWLEDDRCMVTSVATLCYRLGAGYTPERAITIPSVRKKK